MSKEKPRKNYQLTELPGESFEEIFVCGECGRPLLQSHLGTCSKSQMRSAGFGIVLTRDCVSGFVRRDDAA